MDGGTDAKLPPRSIKEQFLFLFTPRFLLHFVNNGSGQTFPTLHCFILVFQFSVYNYYYIVMILCTCVALKNADESLDVGFVGFPQNLIRKRNKTSTRVCTWLIEPFRIVQYGLRINYYYRDGFSHGNPLTPNRITLRWEDFMHQLTRLSLSRSRIAKGATTRRTEWFHLKIFFNVGQFGNNSSFNHHHQWYPYSFLLRSILNCEKS